MSVAALAVIRVRGPGGPARRSACRVDQDEAPGDPKGPKPTVAIAASMHSRILFWCILFAGVMLP